MRWKTIAKGQLCPKNSWLIKICTAISSLRTPVDNPFRCLGERFYSDRIAELGYGERLEIRVPLRASAEGVAVVRNREMLGYAYPDVTYGTIEPAGAKEAARRQKLQNARINMLRKEAGPVIDLHEEALRFTDTTPIITDFGQVISLTDQTGFETPEQLSWSRFAVSLIWAKKQGYLVEIIWRLA